MPPPQQKKPSYDSDISRRKDCEQVIRVKKDFQDLNPTDFRFTGKETAVHEACVPIIGSLE